MAESQSEPSSLQTSQITSSTGAQYTVSESDLYLKLLELDIPHFPLDASTVVTSSGDTVYVDIPPGMSANAAADEIQTALDFAHRKKIALHIHAKLGQLEAIEAAVYRKRPDVIMTHSRYELDVHFHERQTPQQQLTKHGVAGNSISNNIGSGNKTILHFYFQFGPQKKKTDAP